MVSQFLEPTGILIDEFLVVQIFRDQYIGPCQQQSSVAAWSDGEPPVCLRSRRGETRIDYEQFGSAAKTFSKRRHLRRKNILSDVASDQNNQLGLFQIHRLWRIYRASERKLIGDITWPLALRKGRFRSVWRAIGFHQGCEETRADAMREQCNRLRAVLLPNIFQSTGKLVERLIPGDALKLSRPPRTRS